VTRQSILTLAADLGYQPVQEKMSLDQWRAECASGLTTESFACGTAAVVTPIGHVRDSGGDWTIGDGTPGPVTLALRDAIVSLHQGRATDHHHWMHAVR
jgi:branched-chain amino acid aminotransferase